VTGLGIRRSEHIVIPMTWTANLLPYLTIDMDCYVFFVLMMLLLKDVKYDNNNNRCRNMARVMTRMQYSV